MNNQSCVVINNEWDIVKARQVGRNMSRELGFGDVDQARITTAISELARNIHLYAGNGSICIQRIDGVNKIGLKMQAIDNGPGISDIRKVMQDGYTTSGGLGAGLPGVKRLMDEFTIKSDEGNGTEVIGLKWLR